MIGQSYGLRVGKRQKAHLFLSTHLISTLTSGLHQHQCVMKKIALLPMFLLMLLVSSCGESESLMDSLMNQVDYMPVRVSANDDWSFVAPDGKLLYEGEFKNRPSMVVNGIFSVQEKEGYTLYSTADKKKPISLPNCEDLKYVGAAQEDLIPITVKRERISVINTKGEKQFSLEPINGKEVVECSAFYWNGLLKVKTEDEKWGFIDNGGKVVVNPQFDYVGDFNNGVTVARQVKNDKTSYSIINETGKEIVPIRKNLSVSDYTFNCGYIFARDANSRYIAINDKGEEILKCTAKVEGVSDNNEKYFVYYSDGEYGLMDFKGESIIRPKYDGIQIIASDKFLAKKDDKYVVINNKGDEELSLDDYHSVNYAYKFGFLGYDRNTVSMLDDKFKPIKNAEFEDVDNTTISSSGNYVYSDYFNMNGLLEQMLGDVSFEGIGEYKLGMSADKFEINPFNLQYWNSTVAGEEISTKEYTISKLNLYFDTYIAIEEYNDVDGFVNRLNPNAKLESVAKYLNLNTSSVSSTEVRDEIIKYFEAKGFSNLGYAANSYQVRYVFAKGKNIIIVWSDDNTVNVEVSNNQDLYNELINSINGKNGYYVEGKGDSGTDSVVEVVPLAE